MEDVTKRIVLFASIIFVTAALSNVEGDFDSRSVGSQQTYGSPWPTPMKMTTGKTQFNLNAEDFVFNLKSFPGKPAQCDIIQAAFARYRTIIFGPTADALKFQPYRQTDAASITSLTVSISGNCTGYPSLDSDESCKFSRSHQKYKYLVLL